MQLDLFPTDVHMRCINPQKNKRRYYALSVQRNLFNEWELVREWGRIGGVGRIRRDMHFSSQQALRALQNLASQKEKRGYLAVAHVSSS